MPAKNKSVRTFTKNYNNLLSCLFSYTANARYLIKKDLTTKTVRKRTPIFRSSFLCYGFFSSSDVCFVGTHIAQYIDIPPEICNNMHGTKYAHIKSFTNEKQKKINF